MTRSLAVLSGFACAVLAACAPQPTTGPQSAAGRECFHAGSVSSFHPISDEVVISRSALADITGCSCSAPAPE